MSGVADGSGSGGAPAVAGPRQVLVYGSCVTRDMFELVHRQDWSLAGYVARQSVISAMGPPAPPQLVPPPSLSPFQSRMLEADLRSTLVRSVQEVSRSVDLVLWDLTDERLGVYRLPDGSFVTRSVELVASGLDDVVRTTAELLPLGHPGHLRLWREAAGQFVRVLAGAGTPLVVVQVPWAVRSDDGSAVPSSFGLRPEEANRLLQPYNRFLSEELGLPTLTVGTHEVLATASHRWGLAPFHYTPDTYRLMVRSLEQLAAQHLPSRT